MAEKINRYDREQALNLAIQLQAAVLSATTKQESATVYHADLFATADSFANYIENGRS